MLQEFLTGGKPYSFIISSAAITKRTRTQVIVPSSDGGNKLIRVEKCPRKMVFKAHLIHIVGKTIVQEI